uniref:Uncharacterized protein n=1 Tax=Talaromyces marneffei PM1 TaxID=1077442 RepID=A0A093UU48_TALMA
MSYPQENIIAKRDPCVTKPSRWPEDSDSVKFLAAITSVGSVDELMKQPLIRKPRGSKHSVIGLARLAVATTTTFYSYP